MTPEAQRIAIAEACGWKRVSAPEGEQWGENARGKEWWYVHQIPNYLNDLNAMHEAEKTIQDKWAYSDYLQEIVGLPAHPAIDEFALLHATAAQRAEAFLRTIGKWVEQ